jgi:hypothetical protein
MILTKKKFQKLLKIDKQSRKKYVKKKNNKKKYNSRRKKKQNDYCKSLKQKGGLMGMCNLQQSGGLFGTSKKTNDDNLIAYKTSIKDLSEMITKIKIYLELLQGKLTDDTGSSEILSRILTSTENVAKGVIESSISNIDNTYFSGDNSIEKQIDKLKSAINMYKDEERKVIAYDKMEKVYKDTLGSDMKIVHDGEESAEQEEPETADLSENDNKDASNILTLIDKERSELKANNDQQKTILKSEIEKLTTDTVEKFKTDINNYNEVFVKTMNLVNINYNGEEENKENVDENTIKQALVKGFSESNNYFKKFTRKVDGMAEVFEEKQEEDKNETTGGAPKDIDVKKSDKNLEKLNSFIKTSKTTFDKDKSIVEICNQEKNKDLDVCLKKDTMNDLITKTGENMVEIEKQASLLTEMLETYKLILKAISLNAAIPDPGQIEMTEIDKNPVPDANEAVADPSQTGLEMTTNPMQGNRPSEDGTTATLNTSGITLNLSKNNTEGQSGGSKEELEQVLGELKDKIPNVDKNKLTTYKQDYSAKIKAKENIIKKPLQKNIENQLKELDKLIQELSSQQSSAEKEKQFQNSLKELSVDFITNILQKTYEYGEPNVVLKIVAEKGNDFNNTLEKMQESFLNGLIKLKQYNKELKDVNEKIKNLDDTLDVGVAETIKYDEIKILVETGSYTVEQSRHLNAMQSLFDDRNKADIEARAEQEVKNAQTEAFIAKIEKETADNFKKKEKELVEEAEEKQREAFQQALANNDPTAMSIKNINENLEKITQSLTSDTQNDPLIPEPSKRRSGSTTPTIVPDNLNADDNLNATDNLNAPDNLNEAPVSAQSDRTDTDYDSEEEAAPLRKKKKEK